VKVPRDLTPKELISEMRAKYNTIIGGGQGRLKDSIIRIGHLGFFTEQDLTTTLEQLGAALKNLTRR
jgi:aspartate aminotransferase-like enzyme